MMTFALKWFKQKICNEIWSVFIFNVFDYKCLLSQSVVALQWDHRHYHCQLGYVILTLLGTHWNKYHFKRHKWKPNAKWSPDCSWRKKWTTSSWFDSFQAKALVTISLVCASAEIRFWRVSIAAVRGGKEEGTVHCKIRSCLYRL